MKANVQAHDFPPFTARYAGLVSSAYFLGAFVSSNLWGILSDFIGRRPVIIFCTLMSAVCAVFFGLSKNLIWALTARAITGEMKTGLGSRI